MTGKDLQNPPQEQAHRKGGDPLDLIGGDMDSVTKNHRVELDRNDHSAKQQQKTLSRAIPMPLLVGLTFSSWSMWILLLSRSEEP